mmetsp:Transcript_318/g.548  ORF Transcript_318/g.548 Transcript_318/m.548 type:complete len:266 (-) Transcript_318:203-1000(-)
MADPRKTVQSCYQVLDLKTLELHVTCPMCKQVSSAPADAVVACPGCSQHLYTEPITGRFMAPVMANPKDVAQIAAIMEHLSVYHIATALDEANYNKRNAVLSLLAGKPPSPEVEAWLNNSHDEMPTAFLPLPAFFSPPPKMVQRSTYAPIQRGMPLPPAAAPIKGRGMGFDDNLGKWNADQNTADRNSIDKYSMMVEPEIGRDETPGLPMKTQEDWLVAQTSEKKEVVYVDRKMGFDSSLGLWNADGNKKEQERTSLDRKGLHLR